MPARALPRRSGDGGTAIPRARSCWTPRHFSPDRNWSNFRTTYWTAKSTSLASSLEHCEYTTKTTRSLFLGAARMVGHQVRCVQSQLRLPDGKSKRNHVCRRRNTALSTRSLTTLAAYTCIGMAYVSFLTATIPSTGLMSRSGETKVRAIIFGHSGECSEQCC